MAQQNASPRRIHGIVCGQYASWRAAHINLVRPPGTPVRSSSSRKNRSVRALWLGENIDSKSNNPDRASNTPVISSFWSRLNPRDRPAPDARLRLRRAATDLGLAFARDLMGLDWVFEYFFVTWGSLVTSGSDYIRDEREDERWSIPKNNRRFG